MSNPMRQLSRFKVFIMVFLLVTFITLQVVSASVTITSQVNFEYENGSYFTHPGTYDNITRTNNVWYFDNVPYFPSDIIVPTSTPIQIVLDMANTLYGGLGMMAVIPVVLGAALILSGVMLFKRQEEIDPKLIVAFVIACILIEVMVTVAVLVVHAMPGV